MIKIVNYGLGNINAFLNIYRQLNIDVEVACNKEDLKTADKLILPGVGAFDQAMRCLNQSGMRDELELCVKENKVPIIGICVGLQIMAKCSTEGSLSGLGWFDAEVLKFEPTYNNQKLLIPQMGWNTIKYKPMSLFEGLDEESRFYFLHSYYFKCNKEEDSIASTTYGIEYTSAVKKNNIYGVQFHPEKSHHNGIQVLSNFAKL